MEATTVGIDLAKEVFWVSGADARGKEVFSKKVRRKDLLKELSNIGPCLIGMEACGSSHYWARKIGELGHTVRLMPAQFVKPYVKSNKNDQNDARAICEAVSRENMRFVLAKSQRQQDIQSAHRIRERLICSRTALSNEIRGLLAEQGVVFGLGFKRLHEELIRVASDEQTELSLFFRAMLGELYTELCDLELRLEAMNRRIREIFNQEESCRRLGEIPGVGPVIATAMVAAVGNPKTFASGRSLAAWLGVVPRQHSSGGKQTLLGISKRGDTYLRKQLIQGARSVVLRAASKTDPQSRWIDQKVKSRGINRATVAVANKNARIIWKLLVTGESYRPIAA